MSAVLAVVGDLFFAVQISEAAKKFGVEVAFVQDRAGALQGLQTGPGLVIFDLNLTKADPVGLIAAMKADPATSGIDTFAFVPHVQAKLKREAQDAGCDLVVARSVFATALAGVMKRHAGPRI